MYRVMLVDDEPLALEGLRLVVDWRSLGYEICGECGSSEEAILIIPELAPDLVITDIRLPEIDGLGLIEKVIQQIDPTIHFIIVSGYGEFEYAQKALKFGIQHYVLKPIFHEEMMAALIDMRQRLESLQHRRMVEIGQSPNSLVVNDLLYKMARGGYSTDFLPLLQKSFDHNTLVQPWLYLLVATGFGASRTKNTGGDDGSCLAASYPRDREVIQSAVLTLFANSCFILEQDVDGIGVLIGEDSLQQMDLFASVERLCRAIGDAGIDGFYITVGEWAPCLLEIANSYRTARQALDYYFFSAVNQTIFYNQVKDQTINHSLQAKSCLDAVVDALEDFQPDNLQSSIESAFDHFQTGFQAPEIVKMFVLNTIYRSIQVIHKMNGNARQLLQKYELPQLEKEKFTMADLKRLLQSYAKEWCQYIKTLQERNSPANIYQIEEYIQCNFKRNLTLKEIAENFYMHPAYIGQLFQKKSGLSFSEYLHRLRIRAAEKLIADTALKSHEIAVEVGYNNYHSFLDNFKKYTGYTPADYKNRAKIENDNIII